MAQKRMLDKKISVSEQVNNMPLEAQLLFTWMIPHADDVGLLPRSHKTIKAMVIPLVEMQQERFDELMEIIKTQDLIELLVYNGQEFYRLKRFFRFQVLRKDRNPQTILSYKVNSKTNKNWNLLTRILDIQLDDNDIQLDDNDIQLDAEVKRSEVKRSEEKLRELLHSQTSCEKSSLTPKTKGKTPEGYFRVVEHIIAFYKSKNWRFSTIDGMKIKKLIRVYAPEVVMAVWDYWLKQPTLWTDRDGQKKKITHEVKHFDSHFNRLLDDFDYKTAAKRYEDIKFSTAGVVKLKSISPPTFETSRQKAVKQAEMVVELEKRGLKLEKSENGIKVVTGNHL